MSRKTIVLADNSYTIRRIVELSFSDETDIELVTFENGLNLKEKLVELRPQIILVDIKLPEFNGYEVCKFVQGSEALTHTKVFLLKGGFEPIDENLLQNLKFENIITKPFDSNALVSNIKKILEEMSDQIPPGPPVEVPSSFPEDEELPEIDTISETPKEISFSDVKEEIDSEEILADEDELIQTPGAFSDDEVLPSEEITRAQPDKDTISPMMEEEDNPFAEEVPTPIPPPSFAAEEGSLTEEELNIKRNIEMQEKELEIDSLTLEEINIKRDIERQERKRDIPDQAPVADMVIEDEGEETDTDDFFASDKKKTEILTPEPPTFDEAGKGFFPEEEGDEAEIPDIKYETDIGRKSILDFAPEPITEVQPVETPSTKKMEIPEPVEDQDAIQFDSDKDQEEEAAEFAAEVTRETPSAKEYELLDLEPPPAPPTPRFEAKIPEPEMEAWEVPTPKTEEIEEEKIPEAWEVPTPKTEEVEEEEIPEAWGVPTPKTEEVEEAKIPEAWEVPTPETQKVEEKKIPKIRVTEEEIALETPEFPPQPKLEVEKEITPKAPKAPEPTLDMRKIPEIPHEKILNKIEQKLTRAIKEMLWEIVPPLAEKIIKQEIEALKSETEKSLK